MMFVNTPATIVGSDNIKNWENSMIKKGQFQIDPIEQSFNVAVDEYIEGVRNPPNNIYNAGVKHDQGKPKLSLVNRETLAGIAQAMEYGMKKYGKNNYKNGLDYSRVIDALLRHVTAYADKEDLDPESGLNHMFHVGACVNMLIYYIANNKGTDDR